MFPVSINDGEAIAFLVAHQSGSHQTLNNPEQRRLFALLASKEQKNPVPSVEMRCLKSEALRLPRNSITHRVKGSAKFGTFAQTQVRQDLLQDDVVLPLPVRIKQRACLIAQSLGVVRVASCETIRDVLHQPTVVTIFGVA